MQGRAVFRNMVVVLVGRGGLLDRGVYKIEGRTSCDGDVRVHCGVDVQDRDVADSVTAPGSI